MLFVINSVTRCRQILCLSVVLYTKCVVSFFPLSPFLSHFLLPSTPTHPSFNCSCVHYSCEAIDCPEPLIRNAELKCSNPGRHFYNGDRCTISCNSGYVLQIHQDDDIIKSQVKTLLSTCFCSEKPHGCMHVQKQTNMEKHFFNNGSMHANLNL